MPSSQFVNWQPISQLPLIASMIVDGALGDTAEHLKTLTEARAKPHVLVDATIDRVERVYGEQRDFVEIFAEQLRRWRADGRSAEQHRELKRLEGQNSRLRELTDDVLASRNAAGARVNRFEGPAGHETRSANGPFGQPCGPEIVREDARGHGFRRAKEGRFLARQPARLVAMSVGTRR